MWEFEWPRLGVVLLPNLRVRAWDLAVPTRWAEPSVPSTPIKETSDIEKQRKEIYSTGPPWREEQIMRSHDIQVGLWGADVRSWSRPALTQLLGSGLSCLEV